MSFDPQVHHFLSRVASRLAIPSWLGFIYTFLHRPHPVSVSGVSASVPDMGFITVAALGCSLISFVCALPTLEDDLSSLSGWAFVLACALPFFGMIALCDPAGMSHIYR